MAPASRRCSPTTRSARAFTTIELLVATGLLVVTIVAIAEIFTISSDATGRTTAHADLLAASAAVQHRLTDTLAKIEPGLLIIESPAPTGPRSDIRGSDRFLRLRHDRLVFIASGGTGEFQSCTDPTHGSPAAGEQYLAPVSSSQALIYFGPGIPLAATGDHRPISLDDEAYALPAADWILAHRAILLALDPPSAPIPGWGETDTPPTMDAFTAAGGMLNGGNLHDEYKKGQMDVVVSSSAARADAATFVSLIGDRPRQSFIDNLLATNVSLIKALWEPNYCPTTVSLDDPTLNDYYTRSGSNFQPRLADFRIEWTDGRRINPLGPDGIQDTGDEDYRLRWFGLRPDPQFNAGTGNPDYPADIDYWPVSRADFSGDTTGPEAQAFGMLPATQNGIEWATHTGGSSGPDAAYRAIWRADTWQFRPKALRFTYRIYDPGNRLFHTAEIDLDEDGDFDPDEAQGDVERYSVTRYGQEFSIVVPLP